MDVKVKSTLKRCRRGSRPSMKLQEVQESLTRFKLKPEMYLRVAQVFWASLDTPRSLTCSLLLKYGEYAQLVALTTNPMDYCEKGEQIGVPNAAQFRDDYQSTYLLSKWELFSHPDLDPVAACEASDREAENSCLLSNRRLRKARRQPEGCYTFVHLIQMMQDDIAAILGSFDPSEWERECRFGPGKASDQIGTIDYEKLLSEPSSTEAFLLPGVTLISESPLWLDALDTHSGFDPFSPEEGELRHVFNAVVTPGDRNSMVPKNAKTRRGIRAQPGLNVYAQLGLGAMKRKRLKAAGLNLDDQRPNQDLARRGSRTGSSIVTLDIRTASGHISKEPCN